MKRPVKLTLLSLTAIAVIGAFLWMRVLAYWRPVRLKPFPTGYTPLSISEDGRFVTAGLMARYVGQERPFGSSNFRDFNLETGRSQPVSWEKAPKSGQKLSSGVSSGFYWYWKRTKENTFVLAVIPPYSDQPEHVLQWGKELDVTYPEVRVVGQKIFIFTSKGLRAFDLVTDKLDRKIVLQQPHLSNLPFYAISPDGATLYGCSGQEGKVWNTRTGKLTRKWHSENPKLKEMVQFSPDGRVVVYEEEFLTSRISYHFVDISTGKLLWTDPNRLKTSTFPHGETTNCFSVGESEFVCPQKTTCEVLDMLTGRLKRRLPGPRQDDGQILRVTHDWIYTTNLQGEIYRWRAR